MAFVCSDEQLRIRLEDLGRKRGLLETIEWKSFRQMGKQAQTQLPNKHSRLVTSGLETNSLRNRSGLFPALLSTRPWSQGLKEREKLPGNEEGHGKSERVIFLVKKKKKEVDSSLLDPF